MSLKLYKSYLSYDDPGGNNTDMAGSMCTLFKIIPISKVKKKRNKNCLRPLAKGPTKVFVCNCFAKRK